jgi:hypothetical protein
VRQSRDVLTAVLAMIGRKRLRGLTAADVHGALASVAAIRSTSSSRGSSGSVPTGSKFSFADTHRETPSRTEDLILVHHEHQR